MKVSEVLAKLYFVELSISEGSDDEYCVEDEGTRMPNPFEDSSGTVRFSDKYRTIDDVRSAIAYYRSAVTGSRSLEGMNNRFKWITTRNHLQKLRQFEAAGTSTCLSINQFRSRERRPEKGFGFALSRTV